MGPKNLETILISDENSQDTQTNPNTDTITAESTNAELSHNRAASQKLALVTSNGGAEEQNFSDHHKCAANETSDGGAQRGHRRALKMRALSPVLASHVCLNAGTRAPTRAHSLVITIHVNAVLYCWTCKWLFCVATKRSNLSSRRFLCFDERRRATFTSLLL